MKEAFKTENASEIMSHLREVADKLQGYVFDDVFCKSIVKYDDAGFDVKITIKGRKTGRIGRTIFDKIWYDMKNLQNAGNMI